ncbi:hypothetical protein AB0C29_48985 [Actinoplanes sp. NPDC048791]|uniref:hypothetical protein n=1 Tax=Actinoplanes sp. NPDC048791 TaxID=3154623 RepID=UPI0033DE24D0
MRKTRITAAAVLGTSIVLVGAPAAQAIPRSKACPSYACGSATIEAWGRRTMRWNESIIDTSCASSSPTAVVKIEIVVATGDVSRSVWSTPRPDNACDDEAYAQWPDQTYAAATSDVIKGFYVRVDNGASSKPYTRGNYVDNPHT